MVEKDTIVKEKLKFAGITDFEDAYKFAYGWFQGQEMEITEDSYTEKVKGNGKDLEIEWTAARSLSDYFKMTVKIKWRVLGLSEVEVELDGRKKKMNQIADLSLEIKGVLEKDYSNQWEGSPFNKFIKDVYNKYVIPQRTGQKEGVVAGTVEDFKEEMKAFFQLVGRK